MQEIWKDVTGYEGIYQVSNYSRVKKIGYIKTTKVEHIKKQTVGKTGYYVISIWKKNKSRVVKVHRLIAEAFIENPLNKPFINHIDCNKLNNDISNLEWCTHKENMMHAKNNNLMYSPKGTGNNILMLDKKTNEVLKVFNSISDAVEYLNVKESASIYNAIHKRCKRIGAYGYAWKYE